MKGFFLYLFKTLCWGGIAWYLSQASESRQLWVLIVAGILLGAPFYLARTYRVTIDKIFESHQYRNNSVLKWLAGGRLFANFIWLFLSLLSGLCLLYWFRSASKFEFLTLFLCIPIFFVVQRYAQNITRSQYLNYRSLSKSLIISQWIFTFIATIVWLGYFQTAASSHNPQLLSDVIAQEQGTFQKNGISPLAYYLGRYAEYYEAIKNFGLTVLNDHFGIWAKFFYVAVTFGAFYAISLSLSSFLIPTVEYRRMFLPLEDSENPPKLAASKSAVVGAYCILVVLFLLPLPFILLENIVRNNPSWMLFVEEVEKRALPKVEYIEGLIVKEGTAASLVDLKLDFYDQKAELKNDLLNHIDRSYQLMINNVDGYLDWYYSLPAEYLRIAAMLTNNLEDRLAADLKSHLSIGNPFSDLQSVMNQYEVEDRAAYQEYRQRVSAILQQNRVDAMPEEVLIVAEYDLDDIAAPEPEIQSIDLGTRLGASGVGSLSAIVAAKVSSKMAGKGVLKLAARAVTKAAASKAGAVGASTTAGAALGSVFPGVGTAVGALVGAGIGLIAGVSIDKLLLEIEETLSRSDFRAQIIQAIEETRLEHRKRLLDAVGT